LEVKHLSHYFPIRQGILRRQTGAVQAVDDVSLTLARGETLSIVGESGCGKSTLGRCILQLLRPEKSWPMGKNALTPPAGQVWFDGHELTQLSPRQLRPFRRQMQLVFQNPYASLDPRMTVADTLREPFDIHRRALGLSGAEISRRVAQLLDRVGLPVDALQRYPHEFSGGQRQRIGIARAIALAPRLVVADEPVSALDVSIQAQILNLLDDLRQEMGLSLLFISHHMGVVSHLSHRVAVMYLGKLVEIAPVDALFSRPRHPYTHALLSAVPVPNPALARARRKFRVALDGDLPNPAHPPTGCRFHPRCPWAVARCQAEVPQPRHVTDTLEGAPPEGGHLVACHRAEDIPPYHDLAEQTPP
jgi:oligopeptide/dipeptide ABC transporter ATP-binding protein